MGAVCVDMRIMNPFVESVEDYGAIDESSHDQSDYEKPQQRPNEAIDSGCAGEEKA